MKELFSQAIQKMKRKDFLDDVVREKTAEGNTLTQELSALRKKNGSRVGGELDLKIYQINARRSSLDKIISKCKTEIKALKKEILDILTDCYVKADAPELLAKVESAIYHTFEGKVKLLSDKDAGGVMGDCQIVGVIITHDKKKKFTTAKLVKAGAKNSQGVFLHRPQIVVYEYDKKQEEGIFRPETDDYKRKIKERKKSKTLTYLKDVYFNVNSLYAVGFALVFAVFAVWANLGGFAEKCFAPLQVRYTAVIGGACLTFTLATLKTCKKGGIADVLPLVTILVSIVSFACVGGYSVLLKAILFPVTTLIYGIGAIVLRAKFGEEKQEKDGITYVASLLFGVVLAFTFRHCSQAPSVYRIIFISVIGVIFGLSAYLSVAKKRAKIGVIASHLSIAGSVFCMVCLLLIPKAIISVCLIVVGIALGFCPVLGKLLNKEDV